MSKSSSVKTVERIALFPNIRYEADLSTSRMNYPATSPGAPENLMKIFPMSSPQNVYIGSGQVSPVVSRMNHREKHEELRMAGDQASCEKLTGRD
jgi:hypothetical protein